MKQNPSYIRGGAIHTPHLPSAHFFQFLAVRFNKLKRIKWHKLTESVLKVKKEVCE